MTADRQQKSPQAPYHATELARCERRCRDLGDQLRQALAEQARIRSTLQARLLALSEQAEQSRREWEIRREEMLAERMRIEAESKAHVAALHAAQDCVALLETAMAEQQHQCMRLDSELRGVYQSLSWRLTAPLRWINRPFVRRSTR